MKRKKLRGLILLLSIIGGISALNLQAQKLEIHKKKIPDSTFTVKSEKSNLQTSKVQSYALQKHPVKILRKKAPTSRILDKDIEKKDTTTTKTKESFEEPGWVTIMNEDFEGYFPGAGWDVFDGNGYDYGEYYWDDDNFRPYEGSWSAWCARGGINGLDPEWNNYPDNCDSWMVYGPFSLSDAVDAELLCYYWLKSEYCCDTFFYLASIDNLWYSGWSIRGNSGGFGYINFDLTDVPELLNLCGQPFVWIAFIFNSDESNTDQGAFVDNIVLRKNTVTPDLIIQSMTPSNRNPNIGEAINVEMVIKNRGNIDANNFYTGLYNNLSSPPNISTPESQVKGPNSLRATDSLVITFTGVTSSIPTTWNMYGLVDCNGSVNESNEDNNYKGPFTIKWWDPSTFPDLVIEEALVSGYCPYTTDSVFLNVTIKNQGSSRAYNYFGFYTAIFYDTNSPPPPPVDGDDWHHSPFDLYPGDIDTFTFVLPSPIYGTTWSMWLLVDSDNDIAESNESNNVYGPIEIEWMEPPAYRITSITRDQIINKGLEFTNVRWICPIKNATHPKRCNDWSSDYIVGVEYKGEAYEWGGFDDTIQFICNLDSLRAGSHSDNDCIPYDTILEFEPGNPSWATGIDCSGSVTRAFGITTKKSATMLIDYCDSLKGGYEYVLRGDILIKRGKHTYIFDSWAKADSMCVIEAGNFRDEDPDGSSEARKWNREKTFYQTYFGYKNKNVPITIDHNRSGDANSDAKVDAVDITYLINYLFKMSDIRPHPNWRGDTNGDCKVSVGDVVYLVNYLFKGGYPPNYCQSCSGWTCFPYP